jgi:hypothetical protein
MRPADPIEPEPNTGAQICAEIANRLVEWSEVESKSRVAHWLGTVLALHRQDPAAMWLYLAWQTGDTSRIAASFEERGGATALPRQAVQQATARAFEAIRLVLPDLAQAMRETFEAHAPEAERVASAA